MASTGESSSPIYSALNIPTVTTRPSPSCLQWSGDGQVFFLTKGSVYILTPDRGIHSTTAHLAADGAHVKWFTTMIDFNPRDIHNWPADSQEWSAVSLGSMDVGLRAISCSPSNLTETGGCIAAVLTTNMDLSLWRTAKNGIKGEWVKLCEATPQIVAAACASHTTAAQQTLRAQMTCILWSGQADFATVGPVPCVDSSLLVTGTRAGTLMFFRFRSSTLEHVATLEVSEKWITHLALSPWTVVEQGKCDACEIFLAYGAADGSVGLVKVVQVLRSTSPPSAFCPEYDLAARFEKFDKSVFESDNSGITALSWILPPPANGRQMVLVRTTPGIVSLWSTESSALGWAGRRSILLSTQNCSLGSSSLQPVSGLHYAKAEDVLLVSLFDGSIHAIRCVTTDPRLAQSQDSICSQTLSTVARSTFVRTEKERVTKQVMNRLSGMIQYDGPVVVWVQESAQPFDFNYKYDTLHESTFIGKRSSLLHTAARLWNHSTHDAFLDELRDVLNTAKASSGNTPFHILRPIFLRLPDVLELHLRILGLLLIDIDRCPPSPVLPPWVDGAGPRLRLALRNSLKRHLFGCNVLLALRLRLYVADFCRANEFGEVAHRLLRAISCLILQILCRHLSAVVICLQEDDIPFVIRIALQSSLPGAPPEIRSQAESLMDAVCSTQPFISREIAVQQAMEEQCPACGLSVCLGGESEASCANGHTWGRCSVTSFVLSTPMLRTCMGCSRKAFLPLSCRSNPASSWLPKPAQSWVVEEFLEAASRCLFCGNNFVSFL
ncbi:transcription factor IIIC subunit delta N-term-domain-containing protein [Mycena sp. CBHHK59/15]|nr:transcription factor IIIC subunit delta N-term-domain-containing protein [Mycena sp. CBHHK59/15]